MSVQNSSCLPCAPGEVDDFLSRPDRKVVDMLSRVHGDFMVLGAGGKMGLHVCLMLRRALDLLGEKRRVIAVSRFGNASAKDEFLKGSVETISSDLCEPLDLRGIQPVENVIFMAGAKFGTAGNPGFLQQVNVDMPRQVAGHFSNSRITAFSTGCVYSFVPVTSVGSREDSPTEPIGDYARSCLERERTFRRASAEFGTQLALIRLNYSVEFRYGVLVDIAQRVLHGKPIDITMGHVNVIWQRDAVIHAIAAHEHAAAGGFVINVTGPGSVRVRELALRFGEIFGCDPQFMGDEAPTAWINDASRSHQMFGVPETSLEQMIEWVAAWQQQGLKTLGKPTGFEKRDGNF